MIGIIIALLKVIVVLVCVLLIFSVLLQRPKNEGLGAAFGGDTASNIFGAQTTNVLATVTRWLGGIFIVLCLVIALLGTWNPDTNEKIKAYVQAEAAKEIERDKVDAAKKAQEEEARKAKEEADKAAKPAAVTPPVAPGTPAPTPGTPAPTPGTPAPTPGTPAPTPGTPAPTPGTPVPTPGASAPAPGAPAPVPAKPATPEPPKPAEPAKPQ